MRSWHFIFIWRWREAKKEEGAAGRLFAAERGEKACGRNEEFGGMRWGFKRER